MYSDIHGGRGSIPSISIDSDGTAMGLRMIARLSTQCGGTPGAGLVMQEIDRHHHGNGDELRKGIDLGCALKLPSAHNPPARNHLRARACTALSTCCHVSFDASSSATDSFFTSALIHDTN